ncbi:MAG: DNA gyrase subunit A [Leptospiraceae bacterium]|nr:DNA gyrase subunit A [Leptospiraceae bacterium]
MAKKKKTIAKKTSRKTASRSTGGTGKAANPAALPADSLAEHLTRIERVDLQRALSKGVRVVDVEIEDQMKEAYLDYAMSVIVGRALPDVRDGLKPVHRRILFAMHDRAWRHDRPYVKSAKIVGEVIGNLHPHGDSAVYDTLVRMAQDFSMRVPLIDGQGNFGSVDGDPAAAYRYTEARLAKISDELLRDIDKETVDFSPNFDATKEEPRVLPAAFPNLLVNGASGIAVGMATNIPPHNLSEVISATTALIKNPDLSIEEIMKIMPAPDFPTGGILIGQEGVRSAYRTGRGSFKIRAKTEIEINKKKRDVIVVSEIPYQVNKKNLLEKIASLVQNKVIEGIADIRDLSDRHGIRIEIELKKDATTQVVLNKLYSQTQMQVSYGIIFLALVNEQPRVLNIKEILQEYIKHRREIIVRRTTFELSQAEKRAHILEGLKIALDFIDEVIKIIRSSKTVDEARVRLMKRFKLTEIQANAILEMRLQKLTSLESQKIIDELEQLRVRIKDLKAILKSEPKQFELVSTELGDVQEKYGAKRVTEINHGLASETSFEVEDLIADEDVVITLSEDGFVKRMKRETFRRQKRGGKGTKGSTRREDIIYRMQTASTHDVLLLFSNKGKLFAMKVHELPDSSRDARGKSLKALINLSADERITAMAAARDFKSDLAIAMVTRQGILKKSRLEVFTSARKGGIIAINLRKDDELCDVRLIENSDDILIASRMGNALRTNMAKMNSQGRNAAGIIGMRLDKGDAIIGMSVVKTNTSLMVISESGYGKRVEFSNFATKGRGGKGMTYIKISDKNGPAVCIASVQDSDDIVVITEHGTAIRMSAGDVSKIGRATVGVRLVNLNEGEKVSDMAILSDDT